MAHVGQELGFRLIGGLGAIARVQQFAFGRDLGRDVAASAAVPGEYAVGAEDRRAADADMPDIAAETGTFVMEVLERAVRLHIPHMRRPCRVRRVGAHLLPPRRAIRRNPDPVRGRCRRCPGKPQIGILFPEPVGRQLSIIPQPLFAVAQRRRRRHQFGVLCPPPLQLAHDHEEYQHDPRHRDHRLDHDQPDQRLPGRKGRDLPQRHAHRKRKIR